MKKLRSFHRLLKAQQILSDHLGGMINFIESSDELAPKAGKFSYGFEKEVVRPPASPSHTFVDRVSAAKGGGKY